jgi:AraC family transcriptional regulator of arabinose operon
MYTPKAVLITCDFFSYRVNYGHSNHLETFFIRYQYEGSCCFLHKNEKVLIEAGSLILLPPGEQYYLGTSDLYHGTKQNLNPSSVNSDYYMFADGEWVADWWAKKERNKVTKIHLDKSVLSMWKQLIMEKRQRTENKEITDYLLRTFCLALDRAIYECDFKPFEMKSFIVNQIRGYIEEHATESITLQEVADSVGLSISRTSTLFKEFYGKTIMQYAMDVRLSIALERMEFSGLTLEQIADSCGFGSYSYFFRAFRAKYNVAPNEYRKKGNSGS